MTHRAPQDDHWRLRLAVPGPRTRFIVAVIVCLLSVGAPVVVLGSGPGLTVDGQPAGSVDKPSGLGITGALPGDPLPGGGVPGDEVPGHGLPGDSVEAGPSGFPISPDLPDELLGIPGVVLGAYQRVERTLLASQPGCHLSWSVLAGIGRIESGHASDGRVDAAGNALGPILGLPLDGSPGVAAIADTDRGVLDADTVWDRAVGPMQFIPSSWRSYGVDGNGDGLVSPHNIYDATLAAGRYLCVGGGDLSDPAQLRAAVFRYNHSATYVTIVLRWAQAYLSGVVPTSPALGPVLPDTNGNGGAPTLIDGAPQAAAAPAALAPPVPPVAAPPVTTTPPPVTVTPPSVTVTPVPVTVTPVQPVTVTPEPVTVTSEPPMTVTPPLPVTTTPPSATDSSPSPPPLPATTTTPIEPASGPPSPPPLAGL